MKPWPLTALLVALLSLASGSNAQAVLYRQHEETLVSPHAHANPFLDVRLTVDLQAPSGAAATVLGFHAGGNAWSFRIQPDETGTWSWTTSCPADSALDGQTGSFTVVPSGDPDEHGGVRVDPSDDRFLAHDDGTPFYMVGHQLDWLFALTPAQAQPLFQQLVDHGFNTVMFTVFSDRTTWSPTKQSPYDYGPAPISPWEGTLASPVHGRMNLAFWNRLDQLVDMMNAMGMQASALFHVENKSVNWPAAFSAEDVLWYEYAMARLHAKDLIPLNGKEIWRHPKWPTYTPFALQLLADGNGEGRPQYAHDLDPNDPGNPNYAAVFAQAQAVGNVAGIANQEHGGTATLYAEAVKMSSGPGPALAVEYGYEDAPNVFSPFGQPLSVVVDAHWVTAMGMVEMNLVYYYEGRSWDVIEPAALVEPPGYDRVAIFRSFWDAVADWRALEPAQQLVVSSAGDVWVKSSPGSELVAYFASGASAQLDLGPGAGPMWSGTWTDAMTGATTPVGPLSGGTVALSPPGPQQVLHLVAVADQVPVIGIAAVWPPVIDASTTSFALGAIVTDAEDTHEELLVGFLGQAPNGDSGIGFLPPLGSDLYGTAFPAPGIPAGDYTIWFWALDTAGNLAATPPQTLSVLTGG